MTVKAAYKGWTGRTSDDRSDTLSNAYGGISVCSCCGTYVIPKGKALKNEEGLPGICISDEPDAVKVDSPHVSHHVVETPAGTLYISIRESFGDYDSDGGSDEYEDEEW